MFLVVAVLVVALACAAVIVLDRVVAVLLLLLFSVDLLSCLLQSWCWTLLCLLAVCGVMCFAVLSVVVVVGVLVGCGGGVFHCLAPLLLGVLVCFVFCTFMDWSVGGRRCVSRMLFVRSCCVLSYLLLLLLFTLCFC